MGRDVWPGWWVGDLKVKHWKIRDKTIWSSHVEGHIGVDPKWDIVYITC